MFIFFLQMNMQNSKSTNKLSHSQSLIALINRHSDIATYFKSSCQQNHYGQLAVQLLRQSINYRKSNQKHYNVAYIKHNRFLSPSQKQNVAPKITEVIPVHQQPIKIYGKPKVKLDDQFFATSVVEEAQSYYSSKEIQGLKKTQSQRNLGKHLPQRSNDLLDNRKDYEIENQQVGEGKQNDIQAQDERYLSPRSSQKVVSPKQSKKDLMSPKETPLEKKIGNQQKRKNEKGDKRQQKAELNIESNFKATLKAKASNKNVQINSPKHMGRIQKYEDVQSRIKFLIDRDKKNKKIENKLQEQNKKIERLEQRQERLLLRQYEQSKQMQMQVIKPKNSELLCCCSSDEQITSKLLEMRHLQHNSSHKKLLNLHSKILPVKSYKISANPVYPMTSSSQSSLSSDEQIVITGVH